MSRATQPRPTADPKTNGQDAALEAKPPAKPPASPPRDQKPKPGSRRRRSRKGKTGATSDARSEAASAKYPRHALEKALRIPKAVLEQNAGKECTDEQAAKFAGLGLHGPTLVEISSAIKYGLFERP